ncbi:ABC transporter permease [Nitrosomonas aestuarii]|nr:ABC transporter permease [Nitrosomonas aestuarii]
MRPSNTIHFNIFLSLLQNHALAIQMVKREVMGRYKGSFLGLLWSLVNPILMLAIYTFVFSIVFKVRLDQSNTLYDDKVSFALLLFAGLIVYNLFNECISRAPGLILVNTNYVKKIIFPLEILPWVTMGAALFHACISYLVLLTFVLIIGHPLHWTLLFLPIVLLPLLLLIMGLSWLLASIGVFVRDIGQFIGLILTMMLFMSPIFYPASALPESVRDYLFLNPLTFIIEQTRGVILAGNPPDWAGLVVYYLISTCIAWAGLFWFEKTRKGFADVL